MSWLSKLSCSITWHQWQAEYPMDRKIGLSSALAFSSAESARPFGVRVLAVSLDGPGGGWPEVTLYGPRDGLARWLEEEYKLELGAQVMAPLETRG